MPPRPYPRTITPAMRERAEDILALWANRRPFDKESTHGIETLMLALIYDLGAPQLPEALDGEAAATLLRAWLDRAG